MSNHKTNDIESLRSQLNDFVEQLKSREKEGKSQKIKEKEDTKIRTEIAKNVPILLIKIMICLLIGCFVYNLFAGCRDNDLKSVDIGNFVSFILGNIFSILTTIVAYYFREKD